MVRRSLELANWFLYAADREGRSLTMLDVIKLVYIAHGWHLGLLQDPLLEEPVEAWKHGPVIRSLYRTFRKYGRSPITDRARDDIGPAAGRIVPAFEGDHRQKKLLAAVWHNYRKYSGASSSA